MKKTIADILSFLFWVALILGLGYGAIKWGDHMNEAKVRKEKFLETVPQEELKMFVHTCFTETTHSIAACKGEAYTYFRMNTKGED